MNTYTTLCWYRTMSPLQAAMVPKDELAMGARMHSQVRFSIIQFSSDDKIYISLFSLEINDLN